MESSPLKATIGKIALGIYVTDVNGNRISFEKSEWKIFWENIIWTNYWNWVFNSGVFAKKQALHDQISDCYVLTK